MAFDILSNSNNLCFSTVWKRCHPSRPDSATICAHGLRRSDLHSDPLQQFGAWFSGAIAADIRDVNAMSLATATPDGKPSVRVVLLKGFDEQGFVFFTNYDSEKGKQLQANPLAELAFIGRCSSDRFGSVAQWNKHPGKIPQPTFTRDQSVAVWAPGLPSKATVIDARQILESRLNR